MAAPAFLAEAQSRLDEFYTQLARLGEVPPGARFRLEGFLEAGLVLQLIEPDALRAMIAGSYTAAMGEAPVTGSAEGVAVELPVRWARAPVYAPGEGS